METYLITTLIFAGATAILLLISGFQRATIVELESDLEISAAVIEDWRKKLAKFQAREDARQAQRINASRAAVVKRQAAAAERRAAETAEAPKRRERTMSAFRNAPPASRDAVVAPVRALRDRKKSGAGTVAAKQGG